MFGLPYLLLGGLQSASGEYVHRVQELLPADQVVKAKMDPSEDLGGISEL